MIELTQKIFDFNSLNQQQCNKSITGIFKEKISLLNELNVTFW